MTTTLVSMLDAARTEDRIERLMVADEAESLGLNEVAALLRDECCPSQMRYLVGKAREILTGKPCPTTPTAGSMVKPDGWSYGQQLQATDGDMAKFRLPSTNFEDIAYPVNVTVTGRSTHRRPGGYECVRVQIEFVHDGEPPTTVHGWMTI